MLIRGSSGLITFPPRIRIKTKVILIRRSSVIKFGIGITRLIVIGTESLSDIIHDSLIESSRLCISFDSFQRDCHTRIEFPDTTGKDILLCEVDNPGIQRPSASRSGIGIFIAIILHLFAIVVAINHHTVFLIYRISDCLCQIIRQIIRSRNFFGETILVLSHFFIVLYRQNKYILIRIIPFLSVEHLQIEGHVCFQSLSFRNFRTDHHVVDLISRSLFVHSVA